MAAKKKGGAKKKAGAKKAPATKKAGGKKTAAKKAGAKKAPAKKKATKKKAAKKAGFSSLNVNMMQVFALRPRVAMSFKPDDFRAARHQLENETFENANAAARAVAEMALDLTHDGPQKTKKGRARRW